MGFIDAITKNDQQRRSVLLTVLCGLIFGCLVGVGRNNIPAVLSLVACGLALLLISSRIFRFEHLVALTFLPTLVLYPVSRNLPAISTMEMLVAFICLGVLVFRSGWVLNASRTTWVFRFGVLALLVLTFLSTLHVPSDTPRSLRLWSDSFAQTILVACAASFVGSSRSLLWALGRVATPLALVLFGITLLEYFGNRSLFGFPMVSTGFDRRPPGPFISAEVFGLMYTFLAALVVHQACEFQKRFTVWNTVVLACCVLGTGFSFFRSAWLSMAGMLLVFLWFYPPTIKLALRTVRAFAFVWPLLAWFALLFGGLVIDDYKSNHVQNNAVLNALAERWGSDRSENSAGNRATLGEVAKLMIQAEPLTGIGFEQYRMQLFQYIPNNLPPEQYDVIFRRNDETRVAHNSYLQLAAESGLPALAVFIALQLIPLWHLWRKRHHARNELMLGAALSVSVSISYITQSLLFYGDTALVLNSLVMGALMRQADTLEREFEPVELEFENTTQEDEHVLEKPIRISYRTQRI